MPFPKQETEATDRALRAWQRRRNHDERVCQAAREVKHAGLEWLAVEADWSHLLRQGSAECRQTINAVMRCFDRCELVAVLND